MEHAEEEEAAGEGGTEEMVERVAKAVQVKEDNWEEELGQQLLGQDTEATDLEMMHLPKVVSRGRRLAVLASPQAMMQHLLEK